MRSIALLLVACNCLLAACSGSEDNPFAPDTNPGTDAAADAAPDAPADAQTDSGQDGSHGDSAADATAEPMDAGDETDAFLDATPDSADARVVESCVGEVDGTRCGAEPAAVCCAEACSRIDTATDCGGCGIECAGSACQPHGEGWACACEVDNEQCPGSSGWGCLNDIGGGRCQCRDGLCAAGQRCIHTGTLMPSYCSY